MKLPLYLYLITTGTYLYGMMNERYSTPLHIVGIKPKPDKIVINGADTIKTIPIIKFLYVPIDEPTTFMPLMAIFLVKNIKGKEKLLKVGLLQKFESEMNLMRFTCLLCHLPYINQGDFHNHAEECIKRQTS